MLSPEEKAALRRQIRVVYRFWEHMSPETRVDVCAEAVVYEEGVVIARFGADGSPVPDRKAAHFVFGVEEAYGPDNVNLMREGVADFTEDDLDLLQDPYKRHDHELRQWRLFKQSVSCACH